MISTSFIYYGRTYYASIISIFQALLDALGTNGSTGPEAIAAAEKNAALLTARAGARDPSAIPSICRISAALQYPAGLFLQICWSLFSTCQSMDFMNVVVTE